jgi:putative lipoprotein (rSAM/lipoprotein system)
MQWKSDETFPPQAFDTLQTDKDGNYLYQNEMTMIDRFRVVCEDPSGALKADSATIKMDPQGGEGWYQGSDSQEVDFELKKQEP